MCRIPKTLAEEAWIEIIRESRKDDTWTPCNSTRVCSRHFPESSYLPEVIGSPHRLHEKAIPVEGSHKNN